MANLEVNTSNAICRKCGMAYGRLKGNFAVSYSYMHKGSGYMPYCRTCVDELYDTYLGVCKDTKKAVRQMCRKLDLYWNEYAYNYAEKKRGNRTMMTSYIAHLNNIQFAGKSYDDTLIEEGTLWSVGDSEKSNYSVNEEIFSAEIRQEADNTYVDPKVRDFWGADFASDFILNLDKRYQDWTEGQGDLDKGSISLFKQICILEETIARDAAAGRAVDKSMNTLNTLLGSLNLKPVQKKDDPNSSNIDNSPMGVWIRRFENDRPIPEPDPELRDVDRIVHYIQVFFLGHLAKMLGKTTIYSKMYDDEIARLRVESPDLSDEYEDNEDFFESRFSNTEDGEGL